MSNGELKKKNYKNLQKFTKNYGILMKKKSVARRSDGNQPKYKLINASIESSIDM